MASLSNRLSIHPTGLIIYFNVGVEIYRKLAPKERGRRSLMLLMV